MRAVARVLLEARQLTHVLAPAAACTENGLPDVVFSVFTKLNLFVPFTSCRAEQTLLARGVVWRANSGAGPAGRPQPIGAAQPLRVRPSALAAALIGNARASLWTEASRRRVK